MGKEVRRDSTRDLLASLKINMAMPSTHSQIFHRKLLETNDNNGLVVSFGFFAFENIIKGGCKGLERCQPLWFSCPETEFQFNFHNLHQIIGGTK